VNSTRTRRVSFLAGVVLTVGLVSILIPDVSYANPDTRLRKQLSDIICGCKDKAGQDRNYNIKSAPRFVYESCAKVMGPSGWIPPAVSNRYSASELRSFCKRGLPSIASVAASTSTSTSTKKSTTKRRPKQYASTTTKAPRPIQRSTRAVGSVVSSTYDAYIKEASERYQIPALLIRAVIRVESSGKSDAVSSAGAQGLMQLMPGTAKDLGVTNSFDPQQNIMGGTKFLRRLADYYDGDIVKTLAAYHAGHRAVDKNNGIPYAATKRYVKKVLSQYYGMKGSQ